MIPFEKMSKFIKLPNQGENDDTEKDTDEKLTRLVLTILWKVKLKMESI